MTRNGWIWRGDFGEGWAELVPEMDGIPPDGENVKVYIFVDYVTAR